MDKYDIDTKKPVGRGAFGAVYLYQRKEDRKEIIIKQIAIDDLTTDQRKGVFNEIHLQRMFDHPNVIGYHESFIHDNTFMIVMEYAPGGNLFDYLHQRQEQNNILEEEEVLKFFCQIVRALHHIHKDNILHRDMKTHNLLLDRKKKVVKICDFGISKLLTKTNAMTTVGTAHYMSPEVVEGKSYNKKSDVWSLGCILYELITLKRAFDADSLSNILMKIIKCDFPPMQEHYSTEIKSLVKEILVSDPGKRPDVEYILSAPVLVNALFDLETDIGRVRCLYGYGSNQVKRGSVQHSTANGNVRTTTPSTSSVDSSSEIQRTMSFTSWGDEASRQKAEQVSVVYYWGGGVINPIVLNGPVTDQFIDQVCVGRTKKIGLTSSGRVLIWETSFSTTTASSRLDDQDSLVSTTSMTPRIVGELAGYSIAQVASGDFFVAVKSDRGILLTWGSGEHGCLGHGSTNEVFRATVVEDLVGSTVIKISCGAAHVMALTNDNLVYVWGKGSSGNLGLNDRKERLKPTVVPLSSSIHPTSIVCGSNYSFIIAMDGSVYACGNNRDNKLALMTDTELDTGAKTNEYLVFTKITCHPLCDYKIVDIGTSPNHTAFLTDTGLLFTCGGNKNNQLGYTRQKGDLRPDLVEKLRGKTVKHVGCGDSFTIAVTADNRLYSWGLGKNGRLGLGTTTEVMQPTEVHLDNSHHMKFHSLSVCHNSTLLSGKVVRPEQLDS